MLVATLCKTAEMNHCKISTSTFTRLAEGLTPTFRDLKEACNNPHAIGQNVAFAFCYWLLCCHKSHASSMKIITEPTRNKLNC
jgi:hypothetical protein